MSNLFFGITVSVLLIVFGLLISKSKTIALFQLIWITVVTAGNIGGADFTGNQGIYLTANASKITGISVPNGLFAVLATYAKKMGLTYVQFNASISIIATLLIGIVIFKYAKRPAFVGAMLLIYPFVDNVVQKRWYPATAIITLACCVLIGNKISLKNTVIFVLLTMVAVQFHSGVIVYATIPFFLMIADESRRFKIALTVFIIGSIGRGVIPRLLGMISIEGMADKSNLYFSSLAQTASVSHYLFWTVWQFAQILIIWYARKNNPCDDLVEFTWNVNVWSIMFIPLNSFNPVFTRIYRTLILFNSIAVGNSIRTPAPFQISKRGLLIESSGLAINIGSFLIMDYLTIASLGFNQIVVPLFTQNFMLK